MWALWQCSNVTLCLCACVPVHVFQYFSGRMCVDVCACMHALLVFGAFALVQNLAVAMRALAALSLSPSSGTVISSPDSLDLLRTVTTRCAADPEKSTPGMLQAASDIMYVVDAHALVG